MATLKDFKKVTDSVSQLDRKQLISQIMHFDGRFPLDFTHQYLCSLSSDKLRHILASAKLVNSTSKYHINI